MGTEKIEEKRRRRRYVWMDLLRSIHTSVNVCVSVKLQHCIYGMHQTQRMGIEPILCIWHNILIDTMLAVWRKRKRTRKRWRSCEWGFSGDVNDRILAEKLPLMEKSNQLSSSISLQVLSAMIYHISSSKYSGWKSMPSVGGLLKNINNWLQLLYLGVSLL